MTGAIADRDIEDQQIHGVTPPGVSSGKDVEQLGYAAWHEWHMQWREFCDRLSPGVELIRKTVTIQGLAGDFPATLNADLDGAITLIADTRTGAEPPTVDIDRARTLASTLRSGSAILTPTTLRAVYRHPPGQPTGGPAVLRPSPPQPRPPRASRRRKRVSMS